MISTALLLALASQGPLLPDASPSPLHPNVLVVLVDDWGMDMLEIYGTGDQTANCISRPPTPNIDELMRSGVTFLNGWVLPICSPTRASLLTGRMPYRTKIGRIVDPCGPMACPPGDEFPLAEFTIPEMLRAASQLGAIPAYGSAAIGKWHLGPDPNAPIMQGFDRFRGSVGNIARPNNPTESYCSWIKNTDGTLAPTQTYATTDSVNEALTFITDQGRDPWFLYLPLHAGHAPFHVPPPGLAPDYFVDDGSGGCFHTQLPSCPPLPAACSPLSCPTAPCSPACELPLTAPVLDQVRGRRPHYEAMLQAMDTELGRLFAGLSLDNTLVILLGDNGTPGSVVAPPFLGDRTMGIPSKAKDSVYQGGINVPFIVAGAGVRGAPPGQSPRTTEQMVHCVDIFATIADVVGVDPTTLASLLPNPIDSQSFRNALTGRRGAMRTTLFAEKFEPNFPASQDPCSLTVSRTLRNFRFKLMRVPDPANCAGPPIELLFDLRFDPFEEVDLIASGASVVPGVVRDNYQALKAQLDAIPLP